MLENGSVSKERAKQRDGASPGQRPRLIIADGDPLARRVIREGLQRDGSCVVVAEAADGVEVVELARHYRPDVVLMEPALPRLHGLDATRRIVAEAQDVRVVMFAAAPDADLGVRALRAGASGFISKQVGIEVMAQTLAAVVRGEAAISRSLTTDLIEHLRAVPETPAGLRPVRSPLTSREWEVLDMLRAGSSTAAVSAALVVSEDTVYSHVKNIMRKLGVKNRREAVAEAARLCRTP